MTELPENPNEEIDGHDDEIEAQPGGKPGKSRKGLLLAGVALLVLLASAAFLGGRLINSGSAAGLFDGRGLNMGRGEVSVQLEMTKAKELPQAEPEVSGVFDHRQDNSLFLGTGNFGIMIAKEGGEPSSTFDGPVVEVVVTGETVVYEDVTFSNEMPEPGQQTRFQQKVAPGSIDDIGETSMVTVWGRKSGDHVIAEVLVFTGSMMVKKAPN